MPSRHILTGGLYKLFLLHKTQTELTHCSYHVLPPTHTHTHSLSTLPHTPTHSLSTLPSHTYPLTEHTTLTHRITEHTAHTLTKNTHLPPTLSQPALALPKLNLQFLTLHDYLRNFELFRLESTCELCTVLNKNASIIVKAHR